MSQSKCSNILQQISRGETGQQFLMVYISPFFSIGFFPSSGNLPFRRDILKIISRGWQIESPQSFNIQMLIIS